MNNDSVDWTIINDQSLASFLIKKNYEDINFFESDDDLTYIVLEDGSRLKIDIFLHQLEKALPSSIFFRCGWSFLINANKVKECWMLEYPFLVMSNGEVIPVQQSEKKTIQKLLLNKADIRNK